MDRSDDAPLVKLTNAILLQSLKKGATQIRFRPPDEVSLLIDGVFQAELRPPPLVYAGIVRRLGVMASMPMRGRDEVAHSYVHIRIGRAREARWAIEIAGHGPTLRAVLEAVAVDDRPAPPYRS